MNTTPHLNRRDFIITPCTLVGSAALWSPNALAQTHTLSEAQHQSLLLALKESDKRYDDDVHMIRGSVSGVGYHTTLKSGTVHHTRSSLQYAAALMASGVDWRIARAIDVLRKVISLQDQNPDNKTYGIWSWYLEEPLDMMSPPDWNWADFCSVQLLKVWLDYRDQLDEELQTLVHDSIIHAAHSIKRRNVGPGYTNIAMMGTYVTVTVGERMGDEEIHTYGKERLRRVHKFTMDNGSFQEYNSSTYSIVAIAELTRMLMHFQDKEDRALANDMHNLAWKHLATHFHAPTRQLSGPQSRCYSTDLRKRKSTQAFLEAATGNTGKMLKQDPLPLGLDESMLDITCPEKFRDMFFELDEPREVVEVFKKEANPDRHDLVGTTYLHPLYTLGSINRGDFWVQRRPILAYWGTPEKPTYLQVRFLKDGYDFSSAIPITVQDENRLLSVVTFATDYGDTHISLDKVKNATIKAKDLRLRFEFGGDLDTINIGVVEDIEKFKDNFFIRDEKIKITLDLFAKKFDNKDVMWEVQHNKDTKWIDIICHHSDSETEIHLDQLQESYIAFCMDIFTYREIGSTLVKRQEGDVFEARWARYGPKEVIQKLQVPIKPAKIGTIHHGYKVL